MKELRITKFVSLIALLFIFAQCDDEVYLPDEATAAKSSKSGKAPSAETAGNNLSFPVLWAEDYEKELRGTMGEYTLNGEWWYVWGEDPYDPDQPLYSCEPDPNNPEFCIDGSVPGDGWPDLYKAYVQKDVDNEWQAFNATPNGEVNVDLIDWGDDLESVDFTLNSMVRAEVVLFEALDDETYVDKTLPPYPQYPMRHVFGWGSNEVHGFQTINAVGEPQPYYDAVVPADEEDYLATVYSHNARFTIQKLNVSDLAVLGELTWNPGEGWTGADINEPIFNMAVYQAGDGPGYYNAEINVKGKVIYGYTWKVRTLNEGEGYYRLTFSFDTEEEGATKPLNTFINDDTQFVEDLVVITTGDDLDDDGGDGGEDTRGGDPKKDVINNLTYMDILITPKTKGGGNNGNSGGSDNGTPGGGKGRH